MEDEEERSHFFEKTFLLADISMDAALKIPFFTLDNNKIDFADCYFY